MAAICEEAIIVDSGQVIYRGNLRDLRLTAERRHVVAEYLDALDEDAVIGDLLADLPIGTTVGRVAPRRLRIDFSTTSSTPQHILAALGQHVEIHDFYAPEPSLEDVIKAIYRRPRAAA